MAQATTQQTTRQRLQALVQQLAHVLPGQAPIKDFVHHNTLHGYQHLPFAEALRAVDELTGVYGYMSQDEFVQAYRQGRIDLEDLQAVIRADDSLQAADIWLQTGQRTLRREQVILAALLHGNQPVSPGKLNWLREEKQLLTTLLPDVPASSRKHLLAQAASEAEAVRALWQACLERLGLQDEPDKLHPEALAEADMPPSAGQDTENMAHFVLHGAVRKASDHLRSSLWQGIGKQDTLRSLLKKLTGHDILQDYRPALLRHLAAFLDMGVAAWHHPQREQGFFAAWKASAYVDWVRFDPQLPDWRDELDTLPDDALEAVMWELDHLGLDEAQWADYLQRLALEIPGWSGMFLWLHEHPGYEGMQQPVAMMDYLAVRLVLERLYAQRLTRQLWQLEASLYSMQWYFHRRRSELFVRYHLYNSDLPEFLSSRAQRLASHDMQFADAYTHWQTLADSIMHWQQGQTAAHGYRLHDHGWRLFRFMQYLGVPAAAVQQLEDAKLQAFFTLLAQLDRHKTGYLWLQAYERHFREPFFHAISQNWQRGRGRKRDTSPQAQVIFCMDEREEGIRRHLEAINPRIETLGAAAHFNVPHRWQGLDNDGCIKLTPVTIDPVHEIHEHAAPAEQHRLAAHRQRQAYLVQLDHLLHHEMRRHLLSSSLLMVAAAPAALLTLAGKIFAPLASGQMLQRWRTRFGIPLKTDIEVTATTRKDTPTPQDPAIGFTLEEQATRVANFLRTNGLAQGFGQFVVVMGHGSSNENNPHRSAYGCGACSGKFSGPNARILAKMANQPAVRALLGEQGIELPADCHFVGAMHNTCNEVIDWYDTHLIPESHRTAFATLQQQLLQAALHSAHERCRKFASAPEAPDLQQAMRHVVGRSLDFSQARPELGHATNACAIIGRRAISQGVFFDRRLFLISYDPAVDDERASLLEALLLSAGPVGAGISLEYYFSRVSNTHFGSGSKVTHNVAGFFGVMEGAGSDLRTGLPKQMIEIHEPMRLQVMVEASTDTLSAIYQRAPALQELIGNAWILLSSIDPETGAIHYFDPQQGFIPWSNPGLPAMPEVARAEDWYRGHMEPLPPVFIRQPGEVQQ